jgi:hypothetical protein
MQAALANHVAAPENKTPFPEIEFWKLYIFEFRVGYVLPETITRTECKGGRILFPEGKQVATRQ